jgi:hypothetical protein
MATQQELQLFYQSLQNLGQGAVAIAETMERLDLQRQNLDRLKQQTEETLRLRKEAIENRLTLEGLDRIEALAKTPTELERDTFRRLGETDPEVRGFNSLNEIRDEIEKSRQRLITLKKPAGQMSASELALLEMLPIRPEARQRLLEGDPQARQQAIQFVEGIIAAKEGALERASRHVSQDWENHQKTVRLKTELFLADRKVDVDVAKHLRGALDEAYGKLEEGEMGSRSQKIEIEKAEKPVSANPATLRLDDIQQIDRVMAKGTFDPANPPTHLKALVDRIIDSWPDPIGVQFLQTIENMYAAGDISDTQRDNAKRLIQRVLSHIANRPAQ